MLRDLRYRLPAGAGVRMCAFGDEVAVFNEATWDTHVIDASAARILAVLVDGPASRASLERELAPVAAARGLDAAALAHALVDELVAARLIEAEPVDAPR